MTSIDGKKCHLSDLKVSSDSMIEIMNLDMFVLQNLSLNHVCTYNDKP